MRILTRYRDYYDYLTSVHGVDPVLVYDRRENVLNLSGWTGDKRDCYGSPKISSRIFHICNKQYRVFGYGGKFYHSQSDIFSLFKILRDNGQCFRYFMNEAIGYHKGFSITKTDDTYLMRRAKQFFNEFCFKDTKVNKEERQPVLVEGWGSYPIPVLNTTPVPSFYPAEKIYEDISNFLGWLNDNPEAPQPTDNKSKIVAAGFDPKDSFRPKKKS